MQRKPCNGSKNNSANREEGNLDQVRNNQAETKQKFRPTFKAAILCSVIP